MIFTTQARDGSPRTILLEIAVSHAVDAEKLKRIRNLNLPAIELTLKPGLARLERSKLEECILKNAAGKRWLFHPRQLEFERQFEEKYCREQESYQRAEAERAKTEQEWVGRTRRALSSHLTGTGEGRNPMADFFARHRRYPTISETSDMFREAIAKRKSK